MVQMFFYGGEGGLKRIGTQVGGLRAFNNIISGDQLVNIIYLYKAPLCTCVWVLQILVYWAHRAWKSYFMHNQILDKPVAAVYLQDCLKHYRSFSVLFLLQIYSTKSKQFPSYLFDNVSLLMKFLMNVEILNKFPYNF